MLKILDPFSGVWYSNLWPMSGYTGSDFPEFPHPLRPMLGENWMQATTTSVNILISSTLKPY
jgi:hypothetical protein